MSAQEMSSVERGWAQDMLKTASNDVKRHYYDPNLHGVNWDAKVAEAKQQIDKATSMGMALSHIAAALDSLNDSHTYFYPPGRAHSYDYGFAYEMIGERCFITHVRPGSDAEGKGVKPGDEILTINGFMPERRNHFQMEFILENLRPQPALKLLLQLPGDGSSREVEVKARIRQLKRPTDLSWSPYREWEKERYSLRARGVELGDALMVWKFPAFYFSDSDIGSMISRAKKHQTLIIDLRENRGGSTETLKWLVGSLFDKKVKIYDRVMRKETKEQFADPRHDIFTGKLIVLVDSESASASEILARVVQLDKRGTVIGDRTTGSVMESSYHSNMFGGTLAYFYGESITHANLIMTDGKSLEHVGVTPDEIVIPTAKEVASGCDPVLARAAELAGVKLTPESAGKLLPYEWPADME